MTVPSRPILRWHGGKWLLAPWIISHFPRHSIYVEPFGGAASVLLQKEPTAEIYNDLDGRVVNLFRILRDPAKAAELQRRLALTLYAREEFDAAYRPPVDDIDDARLLIVLSFMGFGSDSASRSCRTGFRAKMTDGRALPSMAWAGWPSEIPLFVDRLRAVTVENVDALKLIQRVDGPRTLIYCDPPYLHETRSSLIGRSNNTHGYRHEYTQEDHLRLLDTLRACKGMVVLSGYPSPLYDRKLGKSWLRVERQALADGARARTEVLWLNKACQRSLDRERSQLRMFAEVAA